MLDHSIYTDGFFGGSGLYRQLQHKRAGHIFYAGIDRRFAVFAPPTPY